MLTAFVSASVRAVIANEVNAYLARMAAQSADRGFAWLDSDLLLPDGDELDEPAS